MGTDGYCELVVVESKNVGRMNFHGIHLATHRVSMSLDGVDWIMVAASGCGARKFGLHTKSIETHLTLHEQRLEPPCIRFILGLK